LPRAARAHSGPDPAVAGTCWFSTTRPSPRPGVSGGDRGGIIEHYCAIRWALQQAGRAYGATRKGRESEADEKFRRGGFSCRVVSRDFLADFFVSPEAWSFDSGGCCCLGLAQPHHTLLPSHALSMTAKTAVACNVVQAQVVPAQRAAGVRHIGPFLHVVLIGWQPLQQLPPTLPRAPTPAFSHLTLV